MKKLTKAFFKKEIKNLINTGLNSFEAMSSLQNEYEDYTMVIMNAHTDIVIEAL